MGLSNRGWARRYLDCLAPEAVPDGRTRGVPVLRGELLAGEHPPPVVSGDREELEVLDEEVELRDAGVVREGHLTAGDLADPCLLTRCRETGDVRQTPQQVGHGRRV